MWGWATSEYIAQPVEVHCKRLMSVEKKDLRIQLLPILHEMAQVEPEPLTQSLHLGPQTQDWLRMTQASFYIRLH